MRGVFRTGYGILIFALSGANSALAYHEGKADRPAEPKAVPAISFTEAIANPSYFGVLGTYTETDESRPRVDFGGGVQIFLGREFSESLNTELVFSGNVLETDSTSSDFYQYQLGLDFLYVFNRGGFQPYLAVGGGLVHDDVLLPNVDDETGGYLNAGAGFISNPTSFYGISLRGDLRYIRDFNFDGLDDYRVGLGLHVPFGGVANMGADADGDGVLNSFDRCPGTLRGLQVDGRGCAIVQTIALQGVSFDFNSTRLGVNAMTILNAVADTMRGQPSMQVELAGHTDNVGSDEFNQKLSQQRANVVRQYLIDRGVGFDRLSTEGYGEAQPVAPNSSELDRERNRRVEFRIVIQ